MNLVSEICSYCSISRFLTCIARFCTFPHSFWQDCEANMKYFIVMGVKFFRYNVLGVENFSAFFELFM